MSFKGKIHPQTQISFIINIFIGLYYTVITIILIYISFVVIVTRLAHDLLVAHSVGFLSIISLIEHIILLTLFSLFSLGVSPRSVSWWTSSLSTSFTIGSHSHNSIHQTESLKMMCLNLFSIFINLGIVLLSFSLFRWVVNYFDAPTCMMSQWLYLMLMMISRCFTNWYPTEGSMLNDL